MGIKLGKCVGYLFSYTFLKIIRIFCFEYLSVFHAVTLLHINIPLVFLYCSHFKDKRNHFFENLIHPIKKSDIHCLVMNSGLRCYTKLTLVVFQNYAYPMI